MTKPYSGQVSIPVDYVPVGAFPSTAPANCRGILVGTAGTINVTMKNGTVRTGITVSAGILPGFFLSMQAGGTAGGLFWVV